MIKSTLSAFAREVKAGLSSNPKYLSSKWFYDKIGDQLFVNIMNMPEYYLTDAEFEIFSKQTSALVESFEMQHKHFELIELGAGDGTKTIELLKGLSDKDFIYRPIDISENAIQNLEKRIKTELPEVKVKGLIGEYFEVLSFLKSGNPKVILFMGSNIGNMLDDQANQFLTQLGKVMNSGDKLLLGVDLKKPATVVAPAYNDAQGYTAAFNLNLLTRINNELGGDFNLENWTHSPRYSEETGLAQSFIKSLIRQEVTISSLSEAYSFDEGEEIFMEVSRKYDDEAIKAITENTDFIIKQKFYDSEHLFCDIVFTKQ